MARYLIRNKVLNKIKYMRKNFSNHVKEILMFSREEAGRLHNTHVGVEHILLSILRDQSNTASTILNRLGIDSKELKSALDKEMYQDGKYITENQLVIDKSVENLLRLSLLESAGLQSSETDTEHLLLAMLKNEESLVSRILRDHNLDYQKVYHVLLETKGLEKPMPQMGATFEDDDDDDDDQFSRSRKQQETARTTAATNKNSDTPVIDSFGTDLTRAAEEGRLDPIVGRETEIERLAQILSRRLL